jgi:membrane carboxypeptidase/penicillin-binding protein
MGNQSRILRFRKKRQAKDRSNPLGMIGFLLAAIISILIAGGVIYGVSRYAEVTRDLPPPAELEILLDPISGSLLEPTQILDRAGTHTLWRFENPAVEFRRYAAITDGDTIFYSNVPEEFIQATLAAVDPVYFQRPDSFMIGILDGGRDPFPESLVKELLLWDEVDHPQYQIRTQLLADQIVAVYGREKVLEWYINSTYYGNQIYGASQAAIYYFGKDLEDLDLGESAMLAAVASFPALNPQDAPIAARDNQAQVLDQMAEVGFITSNEAERAARAKLIYADPEPEIDSPRPSFVSYILREAGRFIPEERLLRGGFKIISTLDGELQDALTCTLDIMSQRVYGQDPELGSGCEAARLLPKYSGPFLEVNNPLEMDLMVYDPLNGELLGVVGVTGSGDSSSLDKPRDPGSLITPYLYLNAFTQGFGPASLVWDIPLPESELTSENLHPGAGAEAEFLGPISIRTALVNDLLSPARQLLESQGLPQLRSTLGLFGYSVPSAVVVNNSSVLENSSLEMIDLVQGFGVFVNRGYLKGRVVDPRSLEIQPAVILRIEDLVGREYILDAFLLEKKIISEELTYLVNHVLSDQDAWLDQKTADVFRIGRPVGVKTGYVTGDQSGWVIGYTPQIVVGSWTGGLATGEEGKGIDPVEISSNLWRAVTQHVSRDGNTKGWEMPPGIITEDVCYPSGDLPTEFCPRIVREVFIRGNEPLGLDDLYQALEVNRETGLLASVFTSASQIEERVYLNVPPLADSWAENAGIETPPVVYDLGAESEQESPLNITVPENLSFVRGEVRIVGSIPEEGFVSARLQYGDGLNPHSWLQIGEDISSPVDDRLLGTWDTTDLEEGIYALQLVVIQEGQQIQKRSLILSVDNTAPEIILVTDLSDGEVSYQNGKDLLFEVRFSNPSEIEEVKFYLDGRLLASRRIGPFIVPWRLMVGKHVFVVKALDQAGNKEDLRVNFSVIRE